MPSTRFATLATQDHLAARLLCDRARLTAEQSGTALDAHALATLLTDLGVLEAVARNKGAFWTAPPDASLNPAAPPPGSLSSPRASILGPRTSIECGSVRGAQVHHRAGEPLCEVCQTWSDERHRRTTVAPGARCGTPAGAQMHRQLGEKVCGRCVAPKPPATPAPTTLTVTRAASGPHMTLAELAQFVDEAVKAGASGAETVTAHTQRMKHGSVIRAARLEIQLDPGQSPASIDEQANALTSEAGT